MSLIFSALVYVFIETKSTEPVNTSQLSKIKPTDSTAFEGTIEGIEVIEVTGEITVDNVTETTPKRIKRLDSNEAGRLSDAQKLVFFPSRTLKPPKATERRRALNFPSNHRMSTRTDPRPFNHHMTSGSIPNGFQSPLRSTPRSYQQINNIQDAIQNSQLFQIPPGRNQLRPVRSEGVYGPLESSSMIPVKLAGTYRHPRDNLELNNMFKLMEPPQLPSNQHEVKDPFYNFKPSSLLEINQLATHGMKLVEPTPTQTPYFRRKFQHQIASIPHYNIQSTDATNIYQNVMSSGLKHQLNRNVDQSQKPLSMKLDFLPMASDQMQQVSQFPQLPRRQRHKPFQGYYQDPNYFNTIRFSQLMPHYPANYPNQQYRPQASNINPMGLSKPSQLVVHLNLYPKDKYLKRSSTVEAVEHRNGRKVQRENTEVEKNNATDTTSEFSSSKVNSVNGHPENIYYHSNYQKYNATREQPSYFYEDSDLEEGIVVAPSLVYQSIYRDRPIQLMLKNSSTSAARPAQTIENHKII